MILKISRIFQNAKIFSIIEYKYEQKKRLDGIQFVYFMIGGQ